MATNPDISKGEGMIRTYDLLAVLAEDAKRSIDEVIANQASQYHRRILVRNTIAFIEGMLQVLKFELYRDYRLEHIKDLFTEKDLEVLTEKKQEGETKKQWNIPFDDNFKKTVKIATKIWRLKETKNIVSSKEFSLLKSAKYTRNKLTHPRTYYHIEIADNEVETIQQVFEWSKTVFSGIMQEKINIISASLPQNFLNKFRAVQLKNYTDNP